MRDAIKQTLRQLPSVEELLQSPRGRELAASYPREQVAEAVRVAVADARGTVLALAETTGAGGDRAAGAEALVAADALLASAAARLEAWHRPHLRRVLNASGVVVHTNLGRSPLAETAVQRVVDVARHYTNLEYDLERGERGSRHDHVDELLRRLTGAQAAMVVNNNAAAVLLMLGALANGREVIVSRGQLVEIGGSFRIPDIMRLSGACLVEVGTTNKTRLTDYERAITSETGLLLRVHTSNFKVVGFSEEVGIEELADLGRRANLPVADDLGSGALVDLPAFHDEPSVTSSLAAGVDVVSCSGDKLLGGPQAGILLGNKETIDKLKRHPFARAVRVDKMTLAGLEGTLLLYQDAERVVAEIPTLRYLSRRPADTAALAAELAERLRASLPPWVDVAVEESAGRAGGGSLPLLEIASHAAVVRLPAADRGGPKGGVTALAAALHRTPSPVIGRVGQDALSLDVLALEESELASVAENVGWALAAVACRTPADRNPALGGHCAPEGWITGASAAGSAAADRPGTDKPRDAGSPGTDLV